MNIEHVKVLSLLPISQAYNGCELIVKHKDGRMQSVQYRFNGPFYHEWKNEAEFRREHGLSNNEPIGESMMPKEHLVQVQKAEPTITQIFINYL